MEALNRPQQVVALNRQDNQDDLLRQFQVTVKLDPRRALWEIKDTPLANNREVVQQAFLLYFQQDQLV